MPPLLPDLGYAVPPGDWGLVARLEFTDRPPARTPVLPLTIS